MKRTVLGGLVVLALIACGDLFSRGAPAQIEPSSGPASARAPETLDLAAYRQTLDQLRSAVEGLSSHPQDAGPLRKSIPKMWNVESGGQHFEVTTEWLGASLSRLESAPAARAEAEKEILSRLDRLRTDAAAFDSAPDPDRATARAAMEDILRQREYAKVRQPSWPELALERLWSAFWRLMGRLFGRIGTHVNVQRMIVWSLIVAAFVFLVVLLLRVLRQALRRTDLNLPPAPQSAKTWRQWAQEALTAAARGNYRAAVHACYWAAIARLGDLGIWSIDPSRTPREYLRMLERLGANVMLPGRDRPLQPVQSLPPSGVRAAVGTLTGTFERIWYAGEDATAHDYRSSVDRLEELGCRFPSTHPTAAS